MFQKIQSNTYTYTYIIKRYKKNIKKDIRQIRMSLTSKETRNAKKYRIVFLGDQGVGKTSII